MFGRRLQRGSLAGVPNIALPTAQNSQDADLANRFKKYRQICVLLTGILTFLLLAGLTLNRIYFSLFQHGFKEGSFPFLSGSSF